MKRRLFLKLFGCSPVISLLPLVGKGMSSAEFLNAVCDLHGRASKEYPSYLITRLAFRYGDDHIKLDVMQLDWCQEDIAQIYGRRSWKLLEEINMPLRVMVRTSGCLQSYANWKRMIEARESALKARTLRFQGARWPTLSRGVY